MPAKRSALSRRTRRTRRSTENTLLPGQSPPLSPDDYKETKKTYAEYRLNQSNLLDKNILIISASSLGAMIAFSEKIRPLSQASHTTLLIISIILFGISTALTLTSFYTSYKATCSFDEQLDENQHAGFSCVLRSRWDTLTDPLNTLSHLIFIAGLSISIAYVSINIYERGKDSMAEQKSITTVLPTKGGKLITEGATVPQPHASTPSPAPQTPQRPQQSPQPQQKK